MVNAMDFIYFQSHALITVQKELNIIQLMGEIAILNVASLTRLQLAYKHSWVSAYCSNVMSALTAEPPVGL